MGEWLQSPLQRPFSQTAERKPTTDLVSNSNSKPNITKGPHPKVWVGCCLTVILKINGTDAFVCWDSGSELDAISPDFIRAAEIKTMAKESPIKVHLATKGSTSTMLYEVDVNIDLGNTTIDHPLEVLNLDRWDMILGRYFCRCYNVHLDYESNTICISNITLKALSSDEEASTQKAWCRAQQGPAKPKVSTMSAEDWLAQANEEDNHPLTKSAPEGEPVVTDQELASSFEKLNKKLEPLQQKWMKWFKPLFGTSPARLPPLWEVNHTIPLINPEAQYLMQTPRCSSALFLLLQEKTECYIKAGWWVSAHSQNTVPPLSIPKAGKELKLQTIIDMWEWNANTILDSTPLPNQVWYMKWWQPTLLWPSLTFQMCMNSYVSYQKMPKTLFYSPLGTYVSNTLQQGDCNGPLSWQRFMMYVFQDQISVEVWVYLDDIYIFSKTMEQHENALEYVFNCLKCEQLFISPTKLKPYAIRFNCLGHMHDKNRLRASTNKLELIHNWPTPSSYHNVQRFLGLVEYISQFLPTYRHTLCHYQECVPTAYHSYGEAFMTNVSKPLRLSWAKNSCYTP